MNKFILPGSILIALALVGGGYMLLSKPKPVASERSQSALSVADSGGTSGNLETAKKIPEPFRSEKQDEAISEVREQLQAVMELNKKINLVQSEKSAQLLRIQEQAQIHEKILANIQKSSGSSKPPEKDALLAQEKLRIIREETLRNKKILEESRTPSQRPS